MEFEILPRLKARFTTQIIQHKSVRTIGIGESFLAEKIAPWEDALPEHIKLAYLPHFGQVRLRLTGTGTDQELLEKQLREQISHYCCRSSKNMFSATIPMNSKR
jgi:nicotinamide-nucleotide amidase